MHSPVTSRRALTSPGERSLLHGTAVARAARTKPVPRLGDVLHAEACGCAQSMRFVLTVQAEVTDRMLIFGKWHVHTRMVDYARHYNGRRPH